MDWTLRQPLFWFWPSPTAFLQPFWFFLFPFLCFPQAIPPLCPSGWPMIAMLCLLRLTPEDPLLSEGLPQSLPQLVRSAPLPVRFGSSSNLAWANSLSRDSQLHVRASPLFRILFLDLAFYIWGGFIEYLLYARDSVRYFRVSFHWICLTRMWALLF